MNNLDQIEKFIETQKLKHKNAGNHYDKNYSGASNYGKAAGSRPIQNYEESLHFMKNKEEYMGIKRLPVVNDSLTGNYSHLEVDEKWAALTKKEKTFCIELNMKPTSYVTLKKQIQLEVAKNRKITQQFIKDL